MTLKGIDAQIMAQRAVDAARDASLLNKRSELMQDYLALQRHEEDKLREATVTETERKDGARISQEGGDSAQDFDGENSGKKSPKHGELESEGEDSTISKVSGNKIDIRI